MKVLLIHNYYSDRGGEDTSVDCQRQLLSSKGIEVIDYTRKSIEISGSIDKFGSFINLFNSKKTYSELDILIDEEKPDLAHIHNIYPIITSSAYDVLYDKKIPVVQTLHNYRIFCSNGLCLKEGEICTRCLKNSLSNVFDICRKDKRLYDLAMSTNIYRLRKSDIYRKVDRFITLSDFQKDKIRMSGIKDERLSVVRNICPCIMCKDIERRFSKGPRYFTYMGRLSEEKGIMPLLEVFKNLPDLELKIMGEGPLFEEIGRYIIENEMKNVNLLGFLSGERKIEVMGSTRAMIIPSVCFEVSPVIIPESFALGVPVIVNNIGSLPENIMHGKNGFIYNNRVELANILREVAGYEDLRLKKMYNYCLKSYRELFDPENNLARLLKIYDSVINNGRKN